MSSDNTSAPPPTKNTLVPDPSEPRISPILPEEEERSLLSQSNEIKASANTAFVSGDYSAALNGYSRALDVCPGYLDYELAVLQSNMTACSLRLEEWKQTTERATEALDGLDRIDPVVNAQKDGTPGKGKGKEKEDATEGAAEEVFEVDDEMEERLEALSRTGKTLDDVRKLRTKVLLRRAKARSEIGTWSELQGALDDYTALSRSPNLTKTDSKTVQVALRSIPPRLDEAKQREMADMMGKLKQLGNGILKPFGLSTDNFNFIKDENTGGYNMQFNR